MNLSNTFVEAIQLLFNRKFGKKDPKFLNLDLPFEIPWIRLCSLCTNCNIETLKLLIYCVGIR